MRVSEMIQRSLSVHAPPSLPPASSNENRDFFSGLNIYVLNEWPFIWRFSHRRMAAVVVVRKLSMNEFHKTIAKKTRGSDIRNISDK